VPIDVALLGCAHPHVPDVLGALAAEPDLRLASVWDSDPSAVPGVVSGARVGHAETAIRRAEVAVICAPTHQRPALVVQAARAGRPVLVEKPVARTAAEARELLREVTRTRTPAMGALFLRSLPALERLRGVLREGLLGRLAGVRASQTHPGALDGWFDGPVSWMLDPARAGVGGFGDLGLHLVDALAALNLDEPPRLAAVALDRSDGRPGDVGGTALGTWAGAPLTIRASWAVRPGGIELVVEGAAGTATLREGTLELDRGGRRPERWIGPRPQAGDALRAFALAVRARRLPREGLAPVVRAQEIIEAPVRVA
jgi:predicted dehydrogenase